ncbi:MAG TPA: flavodoxin-dependent (E)-4-hydroxy-3-methylbut-2-enyl-diphosphate synthase [bacterium]|nr:flavodoxin-dependent (E)-4-hydroxy-3-methylbut-2-enyl-diphosphate synthase [bacterium]HPN43254.1 flavodoxin-dependent (E)-4-hydroxy-3-methylbut-2-enyl-diphosphate synthase [bacterium]
MSRTITKQVTVGNVGIGGGAPVSVQSMTNTKTADVQGSIAQIDRLVNAGCQIVRLAVPDQDSVQGFAAIKKAVTVPLVADIHFDYRLALGAMDAGADKIRINPGNIGDRERIRQVIQKAVSCNIPIRVGVNSGSIEKSILQEEGGATVAALVKSGLKNIAICREFGAENLVLSLKSSDVLKTIQAYRMAAQQTNVPLHIGVTEAGTLRSGTVKSAIGLGILLAEGIGDTLRVSLTGDPVDEVIIGFEILKNLDLYPHGINIISCPTCARTEIDLISLVTAIEKKLAGEKRRLTVAIMGCAVNGPGEAKEADLGIACGKHSAILFKKGKIIRKIAEQDIVASLVDEVKNWQD